MPWCTPPRAARSIAAASTRSTPIPSARASASASSTRRSLRGPTRSRRTRPAAQRLEHGIDAVNDHRDVCICVSAVASRQQPLRGTRSPARTPRRVRGSRRSARRRRSTAAGAALDGRHRQIQLGAAALAGQRDANRMKQRLALLAGALLDAFRHRAERFAIEPAAAASRRGSAAITSRAPVSCSTPATSSRASAAAGSNSNRNLSRSGISSSRSTDPTAIGSSGDQVLHRLVGPPAQIAARDEVARATRPRAAPAPPPSCSGGSSTPSFSWSKMPALCPTSSSANRRASSSIGSSSSSAARRPADQREVVHQRLRQVAARAELGDRRRAVALRQRRVIRPHHQRQVRELRRRESERLIEQHLPRRIRDVILAANHMRDLHQRIVDHDGEVVGRPAVRSDQHRIADDVAAER